MSKRYELEYYIVKEVFKMTKKEKEEFLNLLKGKSDEEMKEIISDKFNLYLDMPEGPCKAWYAKIFTYCSTDDFEDELNFFLFIINRFGYLWHICFSPEQTVFLGCTCPCGNKQTILYYSLTFGD